MSKLKSKNKSNWKKKEVSQVARRVKEQEEQVKSGEEKGTRVKEW